MRGKVNATQILPIAMRITPAYAGKRHYYDVSYVGGEDHPRLCGEKGGLDMKHTVVIGSPPPMRGKVEQALTSPDFLRITPAYAGKSTQRQRKYRKLTGSPPPMRGKGRERLQV